MENINNNGNCTIDVKSACDACRINGKLACKFDRKTLQGFMAIGFPPVILALFGLALTGSITGHWWLLIVYAVFTFGMLGAVEMFFLCRHCPYYAASGNTIVCIGNYGSLKLLPYNPAPMNRFERFCMRAFVALAFFVLPLAGNGYGLFTLLSGSYDSAAVIAMTGIILGCILSSVTFVVSLKTWFCTKCVNFSCPLNRVPKETVDEYLNMNQVMKDAWEIHGYRVSK